MPWAEASRLPLPPCRLLPPIPLAVEPQEPVRGCPALDFAESRRRLGQLQMVGHAWVALPEFPASFPSSRGA